MIRPGKMVYLFFCLTLFSSLWLNVAGGMAAADSAAAHPIPGMIEAEDFADMSGIQLDVTDDSGGSSYIGWTDAGDWMDYTVNVEKAGVYAATLRLASPLEGTSKIQLRNAANQTLAAINIPNTGDWGAYQNIETKLSLSAGEQTLRVYVVNAGFNFNWLSFEFVSDSVIEPEPEPNPTDGPFFQIPGAVEVEAFHFGSGAEVKDSAHVGAGKYVGALDAGDWMEYTYVEAAGAGVYEVEFKVASPNSGKRFQLENAWGNVLADVQVPNTGGWDAWQTVSAIMTLPAGSQSLQLVTAEGGFNLDAMAFKLAEPADTTVPAPANALSIAECGATADDNTDDTAAIQACIDSARSEGRIVYVPEGTFLYSACLVLDGADLTGSGHGSVLKSINALEQCLRLTGDGSDVSHVQLTTITTTDRLSTDVSARVFVDPNALNFSVKNTVIDGATSAGIISFGSHGIISGNTVRNTLADGIHITGLSDDILIENNVSRDTGDDQIAVVSYEKFGSWVRNVTIRHNDVAGGHARGITVSGGENIAVENNKISLTGGAGVFIASEGSYKTYTVNGLHVIGNAIYKDSLNGSIPEKGGIRLQATYKNPSIDNALIEQNFIFGATDSGILIVGSAEANAVIQKNVITNPQGYGISLVSTVIGSYTISGNTVTGSGKHPFSNLAAGADVVSDMLNGTPGGGGEGSEYVAVKGTPVIDGGVDDVWAYSTALQMDTTVQGTTGIARIIWDETALYYLFQMTDAAPFAIGANEHNDSVEVWVDELNAKNGARGVGDYQARVDIANVKSTATGLNLSSVQSEVRMVPGGYIVELAVPYTALIPGEGKTIGFNASANDDANGDGKRDNYMSWVDKNLPYWADTKVYNNVLLAGSPVIDAPKATGVPGTLVISHNNGHDHGLLDGSYTVSMNMWYGNNGTVYKLYENGVLIDIQRLMDDSPKAQTTATAIEGKRNGEYHYRAELSNVFGTTVSKELVVKVTQANPGMPVLSSNNWDGDGSYDIRMNMWWGTNGTTFNLYENGVLIHSEQLEVGTPNAQTATVAVKGRSRGAYQYRGELVNDAGSTSSAVITVKVTQ
ncbi:hypothetical protein FHS16_000412 [Paenibacillus endophyticus]|uniref:CBM6 domain-containing protein n=1 Tax=Paenibacillus endophyticus TaxID=1294268 RepID=A0A7W5C3C1_9BACL|nr:carbohydrate-binding protein [Paenibacillus endophyticus]MBB3150380.1 hypothetical protein [Paenibacillus endophyticus]